jgi:hypothetical protein
VLLGRVDEAKALFERLLTLCNDVGLISEEYDVQARRLVGNFPQAFTHLGLVNSILTLQQAEAFGQEKKTTDQVQRLRNVLRTVVKGNFEPQTLRFKNLLQKLKILK